MSVKSALVRIALKYDQLLRTHTMKTSAVSTMVLYAIGDYTCQIFIEQQSHCKELKAKGWYYPDWKRWKKMVLVGGFVYAPICTFWLIYLNPWYLRQITKYYPPFYYYGKWTKVITSVTIDKLIITWPYIAAMIFSASMIQSRGALGWSINEVKEKLWPSMKANWIFWPFALCFIYGFVPMFFRSIADAMFGCIWSGILSWVWHNAEDEKVEKVEKCTDI